MFATVLDLLNRAPLHIGGVPTTWAELLGFVTGVATVGLAALGRVSNFPVGIANNVFFGVLFLDAALFADAGLQVVYVVLSGFGWWAWLRLGPDRTALRVSDAEPRLLVGVLVGVAVTTVALIPILRAVNGSAPFLDAVTTATSLGAQTLLSLKRVQNWLLWIAADLVYIPLYASRDLYLTAAVYVVFLVICVAALRQWRRVRVPAGVPGPGVPAELAA